MFLFQRKKFGETVVFILNHVAATKLKCSCHTIFSLCQIIKVTQKMSASSVLIQLNSLFELCSILQNMSLILATAVIVQLFQQVYIQDKRKKEANRRRNRDYALTEMEVMSDEHFKRMFRMSKNTFCVLEEKLSDVWDGVNERQAINSSGSPICLRTRLACTLRWLAGGSYIDICFEFGVSPGSFYHDGGVLWGTIDMLDECFQIKFPFNNASKLRSMADEFAYWSNYKMNNCVLAIDGWVCRTRCPTTKEVSYPMSYRNRHGCFGLVALAGCDARMKFYMFSCVSAGSTNDILAWQFCKMKSLLDSGALPEPYYFIGDEAFICTNEFLVPWSGRGLPLGKDSFNYHLSSMRQCIERAFALLTNRWGVFWRPLQCAFDRWTTVCSVAAKLHNFCIDMDDTQPTFRHAQDHLDGDAPLVYLNHEEVFEDEEDLAYYRRPTGYVRQQITAALDRDRIYRPSIY